MTDTRALVWYVSGQDRALASMRDPFDRLIAGTAVRLGLPVLTNDDLIVRSGRVRTYW